MDGGTRLQVRGGAQHYLDIAGVIIVAIDADQKVTLINKKGCEVLGYAEKEIIGRNWIDTFIAESHREEVKGAFEKLISGEVDTVRYYENPVLTRSGDERIIAWHNTVLRDEAGNVIESLGSGTDITDRRMAEKALKNSEAKYRVLFEQSKDAIFITTKEGRFVDMNQSALDLFGYTREEMLALDVEKDFYVNSGQRVKYKQEIEGKGFARDYEVKLRKKDGTPLDILLTTTLLRDDDGDIIGYQGIMRDVTERKQVEAALQESFE